MKNAVLIWCMLEFNILHVTANSTFGPRLHINVDDMSLPKGVGSLNLKGDYSWDISNNMSAGIKYDYNADRIHPSAYWASKSVDLDEASRVTAKAEYSTHTKGTIVEARLNRNEDEMAINFYTLTNRPGSLKIRKLLNFDGLKIFIKPKVDFLNRSSELAVHSELIDDVTTAELTMNKANDSAYLEISHRIDDYNIISPKVNLKNGDVSIRLKRALESGGMLNISADRCKLDWEIKENSWIVCGNIPFNDSLTSSIRFKRTIVLK